MTAGLLTVYAVNADGPIGIGLTLMTLFTHAGVFRDPTCEINDIPTPTVVNIPLMPEET